jgi:PAS domain S-box-containing protein
MSPATDKKKTEKTRAIGPARPKNKKSVRKKPTKRAAVRRMKKVPITLHVFRELEFIRDLPDATFVIDRNGTVLAWNRAMEDLTGFTAGEILGKGNFCYAIPFYGERRPILIDIALNPDTNLPEVYDSLCCEGRCVTATTRFARPKGENVVLWKRASPITDQNGTIIGAIETIRDITWQQKIEDQLRASEERFRALAENTSDIIRIFDREGRIVFDTAASERVLGYPAGHFLGKDPFEFIHPDDAESVKKELSELYTNTNTGVPTEFRIRKADGSYVWVEAVGKNLLGVPGIDGIVITTRFIDARKQAELALAESETKYRMLIETLNEGIWVIDKEAVTTFVNPKMAEILGYTVEEMTGRSLFAFMDDEGCRICERNIERRKQGIKEQHDFEFLKKDGTRIYASLEATPITGTGGEYLGAIAGVADITERKRDEENLRVAMEKYTKAFLLAPDAITVSELESGLFVEVNEAASRIFGYSRDELIGKNSLELGIWPDKVVRDAMVEKIRTQGRIVQYEVVERRKSSELFHASVTADTMSIGNAMYLIATTRDISDRKRVEDELRESEARYSSLFDNSYSISLLIDPDTGRIVDANDAAVRYYGYSRKQLAGMGIFDLNRLDKKTVIQNLIRAKDERAKHFFSTHYLASGEKRNVEIYSGPITVQGIPLFYSIIHDITERKRVEESLKESEARYSSLFTNSYSISMLIDPDTGMIVGANDAASQYYGYSNEQLTAMGIFDLNRLPKEKVVRNLVHAKDENAKHFFSTHYLANGERRNVEVFSGPIAVQGKPLFYSIIHDITDRVRAEQALRDSEARMNMILQGSPIPKFVIDTRHRVISWNKALEEASGIKALDVLGTSMHWKAFYESERPCMADLLVDGAIDKIPDLYAGKYRKSEIAEGGYEATDFFPHMGKNGRWLRYVAAPIRGSQGKIIGAIETLEDITGLMEAQHSLRESEERYRTLIDQLPDYVIVHRNGALLYVNPAAAEHLGYKTQDLIGKPATLFIAPEYHDIVKKAIMKRMAGEEVAPYEMMITDHGGTSHAVLVNGAQVQYEGAPASLNVLTDITIIKEAEKVIRRANEDLERRVAERTESLSRTNVQLEQEIKARSAAEQEIHHRVKNNLQIIASMLNLQSRTIKDKNVLDAIKDSQSRVRAMALVHERIYRSCNIGEIDLRDYLQYLVQQLIMFHNIPHTKVAITFTMEPITADIDTIVPIGLIINEMVSNSLKHAFPGERKGRIMIEGSNPSPELLRFTYRDDGVGIPNDVDWKNPTSLGLRLITSLVEQCSGEITMERDSGTVFVFTVHPKKPVKMPGANEKHE